MQSVAVPPEILAEAQSCANPQGYLDTWLKLDTLKKEAKARRHESISLWRRNLEQAGYTPEQLEKAVESGDGFDGIVSEAFIREMLPRRFWGTARKLKRQASLFRFPPDFLALSCARDAIKAAGNNLSPKPDGTTTEFLPDSEGRIEAGNTKWRKLPAPEAAVIEASRDAALTKIFSLSPGTRDEITEFGTLRHGDFLLPGVGFNDSEKETMREAVDTSNVDSLIGLGDALKTAKAKSKKANADFKKQIERHRLALFLVEHWLASPRLRGTWLYLYLNNPQFFNKAGVYLSPRWLGSGALPFLLEPKPAKRNKSPGLCFFSLEAMAKVCGFFLKSDINAVSRSAIAKTIKRFGLKQCSNGNVFTHVEPCGNKKGSLSARHK